MKTLARIQQDRWLGGICSGFAYSTGLPTWLVRIAAVLLSLSCGVGGFVYVLLWIFMPTWQVDPTDYTDRTTPKTKA